MSPSHPRRGAARVTVDEVGSALLVRSADDPATALTAMTSALLPEPGRIAIVTAPSVTARPDYLPLVGQVMENCLPYDDLGVRLVALGHAAALSAVEPQLRTLSADAGREIVAPLGSLTVAGDGTLAAAAPNSAGGGWVTYAPGKPPYYEPAWFPQPPWATELPPETAGINAFGAAATYPVPAGYWILPRGVAPGRAGAASTISPDPTLPTVFLGGFGEVPAALDDVVLSLAALPMPDRYRLVLLPGALRAPADAVHLREYCDRSVQITAAVPVWSEDGAWSLAFVEAAGGLTPPLRFANAHGARDRVAGVREQRASGQRDRGPLRTGTQTAAGWSFVTGSEPVGLVPTPAGFVVEVNMDASGFRLDGRPVAPGRLADLIAEVCPARSRAVVVVAHGAPPSGHVADSLFAVLASVLGRVVISADSDVSMSRTGLLHTSGMFYSWRVRPGEPGTVAQAHVPAALGDTLPPMPTATRSAPDRSVLASRPARNPVDDPPPADPRPPTRAPTTPSDPRWITEGSCNAQDRLRLRQLLDSKYETHARVVVRQLLSDQESPDVRPAAATVTGLVAVRAYCTSERDTVNNELRNGGPEHEGAGSTLIAECTMYGLRQLPIVSGPVFATCPIAVPVAAYETGAELIEPAFVDVELSPYHGPGAGVDYRIWSVSARKLGPIAPDGRAIAMFAAGSRFLVLGVGAGPERPRVMLLDLATRSAGPEGVPGVGPQADDIVEELRRGRMPAGGESAPRPGPLAFPVGLDDSGRPYQRRGDRRPPAALPVEQTIVRWRQPSSFDSVPELRARPPAQVRRAWDR